MPGGEEFLRQWDLVYNVLGAAVAAPQVVVALSQAVVAFYRGCLSLLKLPETAEKVRQGLRTVAISVFLDLNSRAFQRKDLRMFSPTEWVIPSAGFFSKTSECDALMQHGAFFMELDAAAIMESINKGSGINPDVIGAISSNRKFALVYKGEIIAQGSRYDRAYQKTLMDVKRESYSVEKVGFILEDIWQSKSYQLIEILDHRGSPIGEFDQIFHNKRIFVEDKSAEELLRNINPKTGKPWWTFEKWAEKHIYLKTYKE